MPYSQSKKINLTEKKLLKLKAQLHGKEVNNQRQNENLVLETPMSAHITTASIAPQTVHLNLGVLKKDLLKILLLGSIAVATQILLYLSLKQEFVKF